MARNLNPIAKRMLVLIGNKMTELGNIIVSLSKPYPEFVRPLYTMAPKKIYGSLYSLERGGYIKRIKMGSKKFISVTNKGRIELLRFQIQKKAEGKWDKKWRIIIWDIPEKDRRERNFLRRQLYSFGLKELQKSVWISPYNIKQEFKEFLRLCTKRFKGDIRFLIVNNIDSDKDLKKIFKIK